MNSVRSKLPAISFGALAITAAACIVAGRAAVSSAADPGEAVTVVYDVSDLVRPLPDFPAPRLGLQGLEQPAPGTLDDEEESGARWTTEKLAEILRKLVLRDAVEAGTAEVIAHDGRLIVTVRPARQMAVAAYLNSLDADEIAGVTVQWLLADAALLKQFAAGEVPRSLENLEEDFVAKTIAAASKEKRCEILQASTLILGPGTWNNVPLPQDEDFGFKLEICSRGILPSAALQIEWKATPARRGAPTPPQKGAVAIADGRTCVVHAFGGSDGARERSLILLLHRPLPERK